MHLIEFHYGVENYNIVMTSTSLPEIFWKGPVILSINTRPRNRVCDLLLKKVYSFYTNNFLQVC